jgi:hypothetical protein
MTDLLTLAEYKTLGNIQTADTRKDAMITALLPAVSNAIRMWTDREFEVSAGISTSRVFQYDNSGILDIDDCVAVTSISTDAGVPGGQAYILNDFEFEVMPYGSPVNTYVILNGGPGSRWSGEMGFLRNMDRYEYAPRHQLMTVTATWGWPAIPPDVKLAAYFAINEQVSRPSGEGLSAEAIEGFSRSWGRTGQLSPALMIPDRARDLLAMYAKINV